MTVKNIFVLADLSNKTEYKPKFEKLKLIASNLKTIETNVKDNFLTKNEYRPFILKVVSYFFCINFNGKFAHKTYKSRKMLNSSQYA